MPGWQLGAVLLLLVVVAVLASRAGGLKLEGRLVSAVVRAVIQLGVVSTLIALAIERPWAVALFVAVMYGAATLTTASRVGARGDWMWCALGLAGGVAPVLLIVFGSRVAPLTGPAIIPIAGIIIGGAMTAFSLTAQRAFDSLDDDLGQVEAGLALGLPRPAAIRNVIARHAPRALTPILDQTRTVGLVTLPGAFVGVLLGGGSPGQAAAAQVLVLVGLLTAETLVVVVTQRLIAAGRVMPRALRARLPSG
jgi:putative ABC transport system permease protein